MTPSRMTSALAGGLLTFLVLFLLCFFPLGMEWGSSALMGLFVGSVVTYFMFPLSDQNSSL